MKLATPLILTISLMGLIGCEQKEALDSTDPVSPASLQKVEVGTLGSGQSCQQLIAGQSIDAGTVCYDDIDTDNDNVVDALQICYSTKDGWELTEVHFWVGSSMSTLPTTKSGNPQVGLFPYNSGNIAGQTSYCITIPFSTLGFTCPGPEDYFVASHAAVRKPLSGGGYQTETGWGNGQRLVQRGNWAMYNTIYITCDEVQPPVEATCETAFAFDGDASGCFQNYADFVENENRWGWTNGPLSPGTYQFPIYAAAGQCDITKGTLVGTLNVVYNGTSATVTYALAGSDPTTLLPYTLEEVHLYVGSELFPRNRQNEYTIAPGQYPNKDSELNDATTYTFTVDGLSGDVYVIAHAVVCGFPKE